MGDPPPYPLVSRAISAAASGTKRTVFTDGHRWPDAIAAVATYYLYHKSMIFLATEATGLLTLCRARRKAGSPRAAGLR